MSTLMNGIEIGLHVLLSREIILHYPFVSVYKGHTVQFCICMLYRAEASAQTKPVIASINLSKTQKRYVNQMCSRSNCFCSAPTLTRQICRTGTRVQLTCRWECLCFRVVGFFFQQPCPSSLPLFIFPLKCLGQVSSLCFHCPPSAPFLSVPVFCLSFDSS